MPQVLRPASPPPNYDRQALRAPGAGAAKAQALSRRLVGRSPQANQGSRFVWASAGDPALPLSPMRADVRPEAAARNALTGAAGRMWYGPDNASPNTSTLTSPSFHVNAGFSLGFDHYFEFEVPFDTGTGTIYFDGGRIEVSVDGGGWQEADESVGAFGWLVDNLTL